MNELFCPHHGLFSPLILSILPMTLLTSIHYIRCKWRAWKARRAERAGFPKGYFDRRTR